MRNAIRWALVPLVLLAVTMNSAEAARKKKDTEETDQSPVFYPPPPDTPRLQFLRSFSSANDVREKSGRFKRFVVGEEDELEGIDRPYGAILHENKLFVCDIGQGWVWIFDIEGKDLIAFGDNEPGRLSKPAGIAIDEDGTRYVADSGRRRIMVFDANNRFLRAMGDAQEFKPSDVLILDDEVYAPSVSEGVVVVFNKLTGEEVRRIGSKGSEEGQLFFPTNVALDAEDRLFVTDTGNARIQQYETDGTFLKTLGSLGLTLGSFTRPKGVAVDRENRLYVVDAAFQNVQIFDEESKLLLFFGTPGAGPGNMNLPADVTVDYDHVDLFKDLAAPGVEIEYLLLVTSHYGLNKVNIYGFIAQDE